MIQKKSLIKNSKSKLSLFMLTIFLLGAIFTSSLMVTASTHQEDGGGNDDDKDTETTEIEDEEEKDEDADGIDDDLEAANERNIKIELSEEGTELTIESELKDGENKDEFKIQIEIEEGLEAKLEYKSETDALEAELAEQASVEEVQLAPSMHSQILEILTNTPGAPGQPQIDAWKRQYGANAVHCIAFGEGDVYIFTHLKRGQWQQIQQSAPWLGKQSL